MRSKHRLIITFALSFILFGILLGQPPVAKADSYGALRLFLHGQQQVQSTAPIGIGDSVTGSLDVSDEDKLQDGRPVDIYTFEAKAGQPYVIMVKSTVLPAQSLIGSGSGSLQLARVFAPGSQVQYSGILSEGGVYGILVFSADPNIPNGEYTLSLAGGTTGPIPTGCTGGTLDNPVAIAMNQPVSCALQSTDQKFDSDKFFKVVSFDSPGGTVTITATSIAFEPAVLVANPNGEGFVGRLNSLTFTASAGPALFLISSKNPAAVGQFSVVIENSPVTSQADQFDVIESNLEQ